MPSPYEANAICADCDCEFAACSLVDAGNRWVCTDCLRASFHCAKCGEELLASRRCPLCSDIDLHVGPGAVASQETMAAARAICEREGLTVYPCPWSALVYGCGKCSACDAIRVAAMHLRVAVAESAEFPADDAELDERCDEINAAAIAYIDAHAGAANDQHPTPPAAVAVAPGRLSTVLRTLRWVA